MKKYNFDKIIDRIGTNCIKHDLVSQRGMPEDIIPLWVADMDFKSPPEVEKALIKRVQHGVFGYSFLGDDYFAALHSWYKRRFGWNIEREWHIDCPGVVFGVNLAVRALTEPDDGVLVLTPVYYPFFSVVNTNNRRLVTCPLAFDGERYTMNFEAIETDIRENDVRMLILCSPHNPVGRVWKRSELERLGDICLRNGVTVISDEIHADFVYPGHKHTVFASISPELADITVTCTAPSKSFNLAGLDTSNLFISNKGMRDRIHAELGRMAMGGVNLLGAEACMAAYAYGEAWMDELVEYLGENLSKMRELLARRCPKVRIIEPEGTYLVWVDFREYGMKAEDLDDFMVKRAGLWLDGGTMFGPEGAGFQRFNIASPWSVLEKALNRLADALEKI